MTGKTCSRDALGLRESCMYTHWSAPARYTTHALSNEHVLLHTGAQQRQAEASITCSSASAGGGTLFLEVLQFSPCLVSRGRQQWPRSRRMAGKGEDRVRGSKRVPTGQKQCQDAQVSTTLMRGSGLGFRGPARLLLQDKREVLVQARPCRPRLTAFTSS